jgi:hypothetical protein
MPESVPPVRVFISYSHDSLEHQDRVLALADRLRANGVDASIDQYEQAPQESWPAWCETEIDKADFVTMVCTETYLRRMNRREQPGLGHGVLWEANLIRQHLYDAGTVSNKFVPVLLAGGSTENIPAVVRGRSFYRADTPEGYEKLYRLLINQPPVRKRELGPLLPLSDRGRPRIVTEEEIQVMRQREYERMMQISYDYLKSRFQS